MKKIYILQFGLGNVGKELLKQISENKNKIEKESGIKLIQIGAFNSKGGIFNKKGIELNDPNKINSQIKVDKKNLQEIIHKIPNGILKDLIVIDVTTSDNMLDNLYLFLKKGTKIVLANKRPLAGPFREFQQLYKFGSQKVFHETTVGAGLPVIETIRLLQKTGDEVISIQGCFSGTLGFICSELEKGNKFSDAVKNAKSSGFTEADPREDLSGQDVSRKVLILGRLMGKKIEPKDISVESLYTKDLSDCSVEEFMKRVSDLDKNYQLKFDAAAKRNNTLRFVAEVDQNSCSARLKEVAKVSPVGSLQGPDNIVVIKTKRYFDRPMVIQGPGAGAVVTAAGVFGDVLKACGVI